MKTRWTTLTFILACGCGDDSPSLDGLGNSTGDVSTSEMRKSSADGASASVGVAAR